MPLDGELFESLTNALDSAFDRDGLEELLDFDFDLELDSIVGAEVGTRKAIRRIIRRFNREGRLAELVTRAKARNAGNPQLAAIAVPESASLPTPEDAASGSGLGTIQTTELLGVLGQLDDPSELQRLTAAAQLSGLVETTGSSQLRSFLPVLLAVTRIDHPPDVSRELVKATGRLLQRLSPKGAAEGDRFDELDLARVNLSRVDLSGTSLRVADIAYADLRHAEVRDADLFRARGFGVDLSDATLSGSTLDEARLHNIDGTGAQFHGCRMISVFLKEADLAHAEFPQAKLQGAHFERADLTGAKFFQSNVSDADFRGAIIDETCAKSLAGAFHWDNARFDEPARQLIESQTEND